MPHREGAADPTAADFGEMAGHGFSKAEVLEIIGFVAPWTMTMVLTSAARVRARGGARVGSPSA